MLAESLDDLTELERKGWTVASAPTVINSVRGKALDFDGTDDKFTITQYSNESVKTVVFWVNPDTTTEQFIDLDGGSNYIHVSSGTLTATGFTSPTEYVNGTASDSMTADTWQMVAVTTGTAITPSSIKLATDNSNYGDCSLKNLMMFERALSATEISDIYYGTTFDYEKDEKNAYDCSEINPQDLSFRGNAKNGTGTGLTAAANIVQEGGHIAIQFNGSDEKVDFGDAGEIRSIEMWVKPATTTEELVLVDTGKDIMIDSGTVTYTGLTATNTFVNGVDTDTMVAGEWQHLVCVINADTDANNLELANDGTNYGQIDVSSFRTFSTALEQVNAEDIYVRSR